MSSVFGASNLPFPLDSKRRNQKYFHRDLLLSIDNVLVNVFLNNECTGPFSVSEALDLRIIDGMVEFVNLLPVDLLMLTGVASIRTILHLVENMFRYTRTQTI